MWGMLAWSVLCLGIALCLAANQKMEEVLGVTTFAFGLAALVWSFGVFTWIVVGLVMG